MCWYVLILNSLCNLHNIFILVISFYCICFDFEYLFSTFLYRWGREVKVQIIFSPPCCQRKCSYLSFQIFYWSINQFTTPINQKKKKCKCPNWLSAVIHLSSKSLVSIHFVFEFGAKSFIWTVHCFTGSTVSVRLEEWWDKKVGWITICCLELLPIRLKRFNTYLTKRHVGN